MKKHIFLAIPVLAIISAYSIYLFTTGPDVQHPHKNQHHHQSSQEISAEVAVPSLRLEAIKDAISGYNLLLRLDNYQIGMPGVAIEPINIAGKPLLQGHAHLYVNDVKIQRVYGHLVHLPSAVFKRGANQVRVTLNNHQHANWSIAGEVIQSEITLMMGSHSTAKPNEHVGHH